jgi:hypothetical protein
LGGGLVFGGFFFGFFFFVVLVMELEVLGKCSTTELHSQPCSLAFNFLALFSMAKVSG